MCLSKVNGPMNVSMHSLQTLNVSTVSLCCFVYCYFCCCCCCCCQCARFFCHSFPLHIFFFPLLQFLLHFFFSVIFFDLDADVTIDFHSLRFEHHCHFYPHPHPHHYCHDANSTQVSFAQWTIGYNICFHEFYVHAYATFHRNQTHRMF